MVFLHLGLRFGRGRVKWEYEELIGSLLRTPKDKIGYSYWGMDLGAEFWPRSFETLQWGVFLATRFNFSEFDSKTNDGFNFDFAGGDSWSIYLGGTLSLGASPSKFQLSDVEGAWLTSKDGDKLGLITNDRQNPDCILNEDGPYGSTTSETSIWNHLGKYGDDLSDFSPYSSQAVNPPQIRRDGKLVAHLTKNLRYKRRIDPDDLIHWLRTRDDD